MNRLKLGAIVAALVFVATGSAAQQLIIYPAKGQSPKQQQKDEGECHIWATNNTGVNPAALAQTPTAPAGPAVGGGERVVGAARGAFGGLLVGAIAGNAGDLHASKYDKVMIARMAVTLKPGQKKSIDPSDLKTLTDYFHDSLVKALRPQMKVLTNTGPGVT
jgi:hypothetical protein